MAPAGIHQQSNKSARDPIQPFLCISSRKFQSSSVTESLYDCLGTAHAQQEIQEGQNRYVILTLAPRASEMRMRSGIP